MDLAKVEGFDSLAKDRHSKAVINTDHNGLEKARKIKQKKLEEIEKMKKMETRIDDMENKLDLILQLLTKEK